MNRITIALLTLALCASAQFALADATTSSGVADRMKNQPVAGAPIADANDVPKLIVEFAPEHADIPPTFARNLEIFGTYLQEHPKTTAELSGHADNTGRVPANGDLAQQRANVVKEYLVTHFALASNRIKAKGFGQVIDRTNNATAADKQTNRSVIGTILNTPKA